MTSLAARPAAFLGCEAGRTVAEACDGLVDDLAARGFDLPSTYLLAGERLRCYAARGYFQVVDGFRPGLARGVIGTVVATGVDVLLPDVRVRDDFIAAIPGLVAEACAAVRVQGQVVGAVSVESRTPLPDDALEVVQAAAAVLGRRLGELGGLPPPSLAQRLAQVSVDLTGASTTVDLEQRAVRAATDLSGMSSAAIVHLSPGGAELTEAHGPLSPQLRRWGVAELETLASWVGWGIWSSFPGGDATPEEYEFLCAAGVRALSLHPMVVGGRTTGVLVVASDAPTVHAPAVLDCLEMLAAQTAALLGLVTALRDLSWRAERDALTGLPDRSAYALAVQEASAGPDLPVSVLLLDLDDFKHVNDSLGHHAGDRLLCEVARRLRSVLRARDTPCRLGGDEFAVVLPDTDEDEAQGCAERLLAALAEPTALDDAVLELTASIGIAVARSPQDSPEQLLVAADLAMYLAKRRGKGGCAVFEPGMQRTAADRLALQSELRQAVRDGAFTLAYQPIVDLGTGRTTALEALVRWTHPERGAVPPSDFVPLAEESGLMPALGAWVLEQACAQLLRWDAQGGDPDVRISVNVSTRQLERAGLLPVVDACLASGVRPDRLVLEITETALTVDVPRALQTVAALRARGVHIAVDDFGTGWSSLDRLRSAPLSRLKIDQVFVGEVDGSGRPVPIVEAILAMGSGLGLVVVAEGVETRAQLEHLRAAGCPEAQGYLLSRPLAPDDVVPVLGSRPPWAALFGRAQPASPPRIPST